MKTIKIILLCILFLGLFLGCSSKSMTPSRVNLKSGNGAIIVYRPYNAIWKHKRFNIYIDGKYEDMLLSRNHYIFDKKPGKYLIELREDIDIEPEIFQIQVELHEGKIKYIKFGAKGMEGHLKLKKVIKSIALSDEWYKTRY